MTSQQLAVGSVPCLALRVTYVGELGWELYCPAEFGLRLWDTIWESGHAKGLVAGGYKAVDSLRLEKGYRVWGSDISPESDPVPERPWRFRQARQGRVHRTCRAAEETRITGKHEAGMPCTGRRAVGGPWLGAGAHCGAGGRPRDQRWLRLHGWEIDRIRLRALERSGRNFGRGRDLRHLGRRSDREGTPLRPLGISRQILKTLSRFSYGQRMGQRRFVCRSPEPRSAAPAASWRRSRLTA